jgi:hypothetical protein
VSELLVAARPAKRARTGSVPRTDRVDYGTLEHAGRPHRGRATDAEKTLVRENLDEVNKRLAAEGLRTISRDDAEHVERYGLAALAQADAASTGTATTDAATTSTATTSVAKTGAAKTSAAKVSAAADADA